MAFTKRVALVTGGGRGLGRVMSLALLHAGHDVVLSSTDEPTMKETIALAGDAPGKARMIPINLAVSGAAEQLADEALAAFGRVDVLVNNAGIATNHVAKDFITNPYKFWRSDRQVIERFFAINTIAPMILSNRLAPAMIERGWGRIVSNTTSLDTMLRFSLYGGSKSALEAETAIMASDLAGTGVTANVLVPGGGTGSRMTDEAGIPRHLVFPDIIMAAPIVFLCSDEADAFTGRRILANRWKTDISPGQAAKEASDPIAWTGYGTAGVQPAMAMKR